MVHAHRLVRRPLRRGVHALGVGLPLRERLSLDHQAAGGQPVEHRSDLGRVAQPETADQDRTVLGDDGAQGVAVHGRPARAVAGGIGSQHRDPAGVQIHVQQQRLTRTTSRFLSVPRRRRSAVRAACSRCSNPAMSARTGCSAMSLRDTARFRAIASFTAESDVPPRSKKWSRRPIWSSRMPSTFAHAAARAARSVCSAPRNAASTGSSSAASAVALSGRSCRSRSAAGCLASGRPTEPCTSGSDAPSRSRRTSTSTGRSPRVEGHQVLALVGPLGDHHRAVADTGHAQQRVLDLADLDPEAADLDLGVPAAEELQLAVGQPAAVVAAAVEPLARPVRIGHEGPPGALGIVDVPAADADPGEDDLAGGAERHRRQVFVDDVDMHIVDRAARAGPGRRRAPASMTSWLVSSEVSVSP